MKVSELMDKFTRLVGDTDLEAPVDFLIAGLNWSFNELPRVPKLNRIFEYHYTKNLDAKGHYRWKINGDLRQIADIRMMVFYTSDGGKPCRLDLCNRDNVTFYDNNGLVQLKEHGLPCEYTIEFEGDDAYLVLDRPLNIPMIVDYIINGYPKPVSSLDDRVNISAVAENLILGTMRNVWYWEGSDAAFAGAWADLLDNKMVREAIQQLNRKQSIEAPIILGGA